MTEFLIKMAMALFLLAMIGILFLLSRIEYDPEKENKAIHKKKKAV